MSTSHYSSRPVQTDVGSDTIRIPIEGIKTNRRRHTDLAQKIWLCVGIMLLICDGTAMWHFANSAFEAAIIAFLSMPTGILVIIAALNTQAWESEK